MKLKYVVLIIILLLTISLTILLLCNKKQKEKIETLSSFNFFYTNGYAINTDIRYEIDCKNKCIAIIKNYGEDESIEVEIDDTTLNKVIDILNNYDVIKWNGFSGSDKDVLDGDSFSMHFTYNTEKRVSASGYMMWPKNYREVKDELDRIFEEMQK